MKKIHAIGTALAFCLVAASAHAQALIDGQVVKIDASASNITIKSGPIKKFDMEAMAMVFHAQDVDLLKGLKAGDKIKFDADNVNGQFVVTKIEKSK